jgi:hypothetical protein
MFSSSDDWQEESSKLISGRPEDMERKSKVGDERRKSSDPGSTKITGS